MACSKDCLISKKRRGRASNMKWKKIFSLALAGGMLAALLAGCGGGESGGPSATPQDPAAPAQTQSQAQPQGAPTELTVWLPPLDTFTPEADTEKTMRPMLEKFEQENNCRVTMEVIPWENYQEKYTMALNAGEGPDIGYMYAEMFPTFIDAGAVEDVSAYITDEDRASYLYLDAAEMFGGTYGMPIVGGVPFVMYYNQDILDSIEEQAPETWDDFYRICEKATQDTDGDGEIDQYGFTLGWNSTSFGSMNSNWYMWLWQAGGDLFSDDLKSVRFHEQAGLDAATFILSLKPFMPEEAMSLSTSDAFKKIFGEGNAAFGVTRSSQVQDTQFATTYPNLKWNYVTSLQNVSYGTFGAVDSLTLMSACEDKPLAWSLMKYMTSAAFMTEYHKLCPGAPLTREEPYQGDAKMERIVTTDVDKFRTLTVAPKGVEIYDYLWKQLQTMYEGTQTPQQALDEAARYANEMLDEYWAGR